jgi:hypothetical protein
MADQDLQNQTPQSVEGVGEVDESARLTHGGWKGQDTTTDSGTVGTNNEATTDDGGVAIDGGKLAGNIDDFHRELQEGPRPVPGADKHHHPAHAMSKGETKHKGV